MRRRFPAQLRGISALVLVLVSEMQQSHSDLPAILPRPTYGD